MRKLIKVFLTAIIIAIVIGSVFYYVGNRYHDEIYMYYRENILKVKNDIKIDKNSYFKYNNYAYVQNTDDFVAKDKKHLFNIFYTIVNSGTEKFTFYCDKKYKSCVNDITKLVEDKNELSSINNFVHPYNSFEKLSTSYDKYGQVNVEIEKVYSDNDIQILNKKIDEIINSEIKPKMKVSQKIEKIHNYIINNGKYAGDSIRNDNPDKKYNKANDVLLDGYGLCSSYADAMALFLYKFELDNYKVASEKHIWNLVNVDGKWLHLDLTWDDPITSNGKDKLLKVFLLINNKQLKELKVKKHDYNKNIYVEAN